jgi:hypothetical protein
MFILCLFASVVLAASLPTLPTLNQITSITFATSYGCPGSNYQTSGLFLTQQSQAMNAPELLLYSTGFLISMAGNDMGGIADLGTFPLANTSAHLAFNTINTVGAWSNFTQEIDTAVVGHTYAALLARDNLRALLAFNVVGWQAPCGPMQIQFAVLLYEVHKITQRAPGFNWTATNN